MTMNYEKVLKAYEMLKALMAGGMDYPTAEERASAKCNLTLKENEALREEYDNECANS